jgi:disulfide bond formation protein DsbB
MISRASLLPLSFAAALLLSGCPGPAAPPQAAAPRAPIKTKAKAAPSGADLYKSSCSACHGADAKGIPNIGKDLVGGEFCRTQTEDQLLDFVKKGRTSDDPLNTTKVAMPPKGGNPALSDSDIRSIIQYVKTLQQAPPS